MSNKETPIDYGSADTAVKKNAHPEVERRNKEIEAVHLTPEIEKAASMHGIYLMKQKIWQLRQNENPDFKARNEPLKEISKKD